MTEHGSIIYRGVRMTPQWPDRIRAAQAETASGLQGRFYQRVRYGSERDDWGANKQPCDSCGVIKGEFHVPGCCIERCPRCDGQAYWCECNDD